MISMLCTVAKTYKKGAAETFKNLKVHFLRGYDRKD